MKPNMIFSMFSLLIIIGCQEHIKNDLTEAGLKGKIKSIRQKAGNAVEKFGDIVFDDEADSSQYIIIQNFNKKGKMVEYIEQDIGGNTIRKTIFDYDKNWNLIRATTLNKDGSSEVSEPFRYDENGNLIEQKDYYTFKYKYDNKGNCIESNEYDNEGKPDEKINFKYDKSGAVIEEDHFNYSGIGLDYYKYKYLGNLDNNSIEKLMYNSDGKLIDKIVQKWTENGTSRKPIKYYDFQEDIVFFIDPYFKTSTEIEYSRFDVVNGVIDEDPMEHIIAKFDDKGNMIEYKEDDHEKGFIKYEYDNKGNWIKCITFEEKEPQTMDTREITYY